MANKKKVEVELIFDSKGAVTGIKTADGELLNLEKTTEKVDKSAGRLTNTMKLGLAAALVGVAAAARKGISVMGESAQLAETQSIAERKLAASLRNVGDASEEKQQMLKALAAEVQTYSNFGDESIITAQAMLGTFALNADQIAALTPRLADMAAGLSKANGETVDLNTVAISLGKAYAGGASTLKEYGIVLTSTQEAALGAASGMERVRLIGEIIDQNFAGMARATMSARDQMENAIGDLKESLGKNLAPEIDDLHNRVTAFVSDPETIKMAEKVGAVLVDIGKGVVRFFQFSVPIAYNKTKALLSGFAADVLEKTGTVVAVLANPLDAIRGRKVENPFQDMINGLGDVSEAATAATEALYNKELQQSADLLLARMQAEENRKLADSINLVTQAETARGAAKRTTPIEGVSGAGLQTPEDNTEQIIDKRVAAYARELSFFEEAIGHKVRLIEQEQAAQMALAMAYKESGRQQLASADTSIQSLNQVRDIAIGGIMDMIQAKIAQLIINALPPIPFPANLVVWPTVAGLTNLALNKITDNILPGFEDGVTNFEGGLARVHAGELLVNMAPGTNVITNENTDKLLNAISGSGRASLDIGPVVKKLDQIMRSHEALTRSMEGRPVVAFMDTYQANNELKRHQKQQGGIGNG